jgi:ferritin heavy chain
MSYQYHAMSNYFNRDNVGLPGFSAFFRACSLEERNHAQQLMDFQVWHARTVMMPPSPPLCLDFMRAVPFEFSTVHH